jgi:hypothetical protein
MNSLKLKFVLLLLIVGLLSACASPPTEAATSEPTETAVPPTDTAAPATELPTDTATEPPAATDTSVPAAAGATVSFTNDILPLIESRCINCHGGDRTEEGLDLKSHASIMAGSENGSVVTPGDPANSLLAEMVINKKMPKRGPKLTPPQVQLIVDWINQGALDN